MKRKIIIGSRGSDLALWQAEHVKANLKSIGIDSEIKIIKTQGDKIQDLSFDKLEGKGFFTKEIEDALIAKETDLAVHSHKDLPTTSPIGLKIAAVSDREDPAELILIRKEAVDLTLKFSFKKEAIIGTSSARRKCQLLAHRNDITIKDIRGNVPTRIDKLRKGNFDAIVLAAAGVTRLKIDLSEFHVVKPDLRDFVPAPAQGVLALQVREEDEWLIESLKKLTSVQTQEEINIERKILNLFDGGCQLPLGVYCKKEDGVYKVTAVKATDWSTPPKRIYEEASDAHGLAERVVDKFINVKPCRVLVTRDLEEDNYFYSSLISNRFQVFGESFIEVIPVAFKEFPPTDWIFFASRNSVKYFLENKPELKKNVKFGVMGKGTEDTLRSFGHTADFIGNHPDPAEIGKAFGNIAGNSSVLIPCAEGSMRSVKKQISEKTKVTELIVYKSIPFQKKTSPEAEVIIFTSPSNVEGFFNSNNLEKVQRVIAIGPVTAEKLRSYGVSDPVLPELPDENGLLEAVFGLSLESRES
jgi:hydroxymethylbilane synthase